MLSYSAQVFNIVEGNGRNEREAVDTLRILFRKSREMFWILQLRTPFPYDLNDYIEKEPTKKVIHDLVFFSYKKSSKNNKRKSSLSPQYHNIGSFYEIIL